MQLGPLTTHEHEYALPDARPSGILNWQTIKNFSSGQDVSFWVLPFGESQTQIEVPPGTTGPPKSA
jgi:hypothetical protein